MHLIEGLPDRQFAVYAKFHHAALDGVAPPTCCESMVHRPYGRIHYSPLSMAARERYVATLGVDAPAEQELRNVAESLKATFDSSANLLGALRKYVGAWTGSGGSGGAVAECAPFCHQHQGGWSPPLCRPVLAFCPHPRGRQGPGRHLQ